MWTPYIVPVEFVMKLLPKIPYPKRTTLIGCLLAGFIYTTSVFLAICCFILISICFTSIVIANARELRQEANRQQNSIKSPTSTASSLAPNLQLQKTFLPSTSNVPAFSETVKPSEKVNQLPKPK